MFGRWQEERERLTRIDERIAANNERIAENNERIAENNERIAKTDELVAENHRVALEMQREFREEFRVYRQEAHELLAGEKARTEDLRQFMRELLLRNEKVVNGWIAEAKAMTAEINEGREQLRANTKAVLSVLGRLEGSGGTA